MPGKNEEVGKRLVALKGEHMTPVQAIKTLHLEFGLSLAEAKQAFARSPAWAVEAAAGEALHEEVSRLCDRSGL